MRASRSAKNSSSTPRPFAQSKSSLTKITAWSVSLAAMMTITTLISWRSLARDVIHPTSQDLREEFLEQEKRKAQNLRDIAETCSKVKTIFNQMEHYGENGEVLYGVDNRAGIWEVIRERSGLCRTRRSYELGEEATIQYGPIHNRQKARIMFWLEGGALCSYRKKSDQNVTSMCFSKVP